MISHNVKSFLFTAVLLMLQLPFGYSFTWSNLLYAMRACPAMGRVCPPCPKDGPGAHAPHCKAANSGSGGSSGSGSSGSSSGSTGSSSAYYADSSSESGSSASKSTSTGSGAANDSFRYDSKSSSNMFKYIVGGTLVAGIVAGAVWHKRQSEKKESDDLGKPISGSVARRLEEGTLTGPSRTTFITGVDNRVATLASIPPRSSGGFVEMNANYSRA